MLRPKPNAFVLSSPAQPGVSKGEGIRPYFS